MLGLPHVCQACSSRSLLPSLHYFDSLYIWRVDLIPHLHANSRKLVAEENACVDASAADVDADACKWIAVLLANEENIPDLGCLGAGFAEELCACPSRVQDGNLFCVKVANWVLKVGCRRGRRRVCL